MNTQELLKKIQSDAQSLVWWKDEQRARGEDIVNDPKKGERPWIIPESTGQFLHDLIVKNNFKSVLELGTSIGYSTIWIADALSQTNGYIHTIEHSLNKIPVAQNYFQESGLSNLITLHQGNILDILKQFPDDAKFDFVFMDADRGHYHEYFPIIKKHLLPGAILVADNAGNMSGRMQPFFDLLNQEGISFKVLDMDNGILITDQVERHSS
jgi:predicted O-methyltransferase YrrM